MNRASFLFHSYNEFIACFYESWIYEIWIFSMKCLVCFDLNGFSFTGKSMSEALILASTNTQYDQILRVQYKKTTSSIHAAHKLLFVFVLTFRIICVHNMFWQCSELKIFMYWTGNSMDNLLSYCGLVDARINTSEKDLPVINNLTCILI